MDSKIFASYKKAKIAFYLPQVKFKEHIGLSGNIKLSQRTGSTTFKVGSHLHIGILEIVAAGYYNWLFCYCTAEVQ